MPEHQCAKYSKICCLEAIDHLLLALFKIRKLIGIAMS